MHTKHFWNNLHQVHSKPKYLKVIGSKKPNDLNSTGTCFIKKIYAPSSSLLQGKHLPFSPSPLRLNIFRLFVILSLTQLYHYTPEIYLFTTSTFKYTYRAPLRRIGQEYQRTQLVLFLSHWNGYSHFRFALDFSYAFGIL